MSNQMAYNKDTPDAGDTSLPVTGKYIHSSKLLKSITLRKQHCSPFAVLFSFYVKNKSISKLFYLLSQRLTHILAAV
jgi:hypothetical protein